MVLAQAKVGILYRGVNSDVCFANDRFCEIVGRSEDELRNLSYESYTHADVLERNRQLLDDHSRAGTPFEIEKRYVRPDGSIVTCAVCVSFVRDEDGTDLCVIVAQDVTQQRAIERRLRESEEHYRYAQELNPQLPWTADASGRITEVSPRWLEMSGLSTQTALGDGWIAVIHPEDAERAVQRWSESLRTGEPLDVSYRIRVKDGSFRCFRARAGARRDDGGRIVRWYGTAEDIEDQVRAEAALRDTAERFRLVSQATQDVIWDWDLTTDEVHLSGALNMLCGYVPPEPGLRWWAGQLHPDDRDRIIDGLTRFIAADGAQWQGEYRFRRGDGSYAHVLDRGFLLRDPEGRPLRMIGAMTDLSERMAAEARVQQLQNQLIRLSSQNAMGTMASTLAHELNQPLTAATNWINTARTLLGRMADLPEGLIRAQTEAGNSVLRAAEIIGRLRRMVTGGGVSRVAEDLDAIVREAGSLIMVDAHGSGVVCRFDVANICVSIDRVQIQQVLLNLMRNSMEALRGSARREIAVGAVLVGDFVEVSVTDSGPGIADEVIDALFTPFTTTKGNGMGLGLSICRTIIEAHGGRIWAENRPQGGARFCFTLPRGGEPKGETA